MHLADLPDDAYRAHWLAFHEQVDWSAYQDVTRVPITCDGPEALYRRNKGSFMDRLRKDVHCRPYAAHARRAKRSGAWVAEDRLTEISQIPALDLTSAPQRAPVDLGRMLHKYFRLPLRPWPEHAVLTVNRAPQLKG